MGVFQRHLWAGKAEKLIGVRLRLNLRCVHDLTARSPLTAMSLVRTAYFLQRHFCGYRDPASTKNSLKAEQAGAFFSSDQRRKKAHRTGRSKRVFKWYERAFKLQECQPSNGWVGPSASSNCRNANHLTDGSAHASLNPSAPTPTKSTLKHNWCALGHPSCQFARPGCCARCALAARCHSPSPRPHRVYGWR